MDSEGDSEEDSEVDAVLWTRKVVDTDDEVSAGSLGSTSSGDDLDKHILPLKAATGAPATGGEAATGADEATTGAKNRRTGFEPLWADPYFSVWGHPNVDFLRMVMREQWRRPLPDGMGVVAGSKQLTPRHYGEHCNDPVRSLLLFRAWALWRARQNGWANAQRGRARHFREQASLLEQDITALDCRLLGNAKANSLLKSWAPDIVERLLA